jgi:hypothetical protein
MSVGDLFCGSVRLDSVDVAAIATVLVFVCIAEDHTDGFFGNFGPHQLGRLRQSFSDVGKPTQFNHTLSCMISGITNSGKNTETDGFSLKYLKHF